MRIDNPIGLQAALTGSFSGSFVGDGSGLTGVGGGGGIFAKTGSSQNTTNNLEITGSVTATSFVGDGSGLTGLSAGIFAKTGSFQNTTNNLEITGSITVTASGSFGRVNASVLSGSFVGDGSNLTGVGGGSIWTTVGSVKRSSNNLELTGSFTTTGNVTVGGTLTELSTRALKTNITLLGTELEKLEKLEPVSFTWKETGEEDLGFIAEDVNEIYPVLVTKDDEQAIRGIHYTKLTSVLVKAVQELSSRVKALEEQIKDHIVD